MTTESHADMPDALPEAGWCWQCGYDLRGLGEPRCPECGFRFELEAVRELNTIWVGERIMGFQFANLVQALANSVAILGLIGKRNIVTAFHIFVIVGIVFIPVYAIVMLRKIRNSLSGSSTDASGGKMGLLNRVWDFLTDSSRVPDPLGLARRSSAGTTPFPPWASHGIVVFILISPLMFWPIARLIVLLAGLLLFALEMQSDREGRRRHRFYGVDPDGVASLDFARKVSIFLACLSVIACTAVIATEF